MSRKLDGLARWPSFWDTRAAIGTADTPAEPMSGFILPPVIFDGDGEKIQKMLRDAVQKGAQYALVGNLGHLDAVRKAGLIPVGDYRLNVTNGESLAALEKLGLDSVILSPELTLPQLRDVGGNSSVIVYGRLPLMTLEKCVIREIADCKRCSTDRVLLRDRRGVEFPVLREWEHRNVIYNSLPTCMSDREDHLARAGVVARHFLFTVETPDEVDSVIDAHRKGLPIRGQVRRISS
jgi:putative protease